MVFFRFFGSRGLRPQVSCWLRMDIPFQTLEILAILERMTLSQSKNLTDRQSAAVGENSTTGVNLP